VSGPDDVIDFWFGPLDPQGRMAPAQRMKWFKKDDAFDAEIRARFGAVHDAATKGELHDAATKGELDPWTATARGRLALIVVLDQFSRNLFRGSPRSFAGDARALQIAREAVRLRQDREVFEDGRPSFYMPFMHAEDLAMQDAAVALFEAWDAERGEENGEGVKFARMHRDIIRRFGRFPHRNAILGRASTDEELAFLQTPGSSF
jgi:uncharacterized protein (DUF924 family)